MNINLNPNSELNQSIVNVPDVVQVPDVWINEARQFRMAMMMYACAIREVKTKLEVLNDELSIKNQRNPIEMIKSRVKKPMSILEKLQRRGLPVSVESMVKNLDDVAGIRIICSFVDDIYEVAEMLVRQDVTADIEGRHVLILEDIFDTGNSLEFTVNHLKKQNPASIKICTLLDKPERRRAGVTLKADYVGFTIPNAFVVGYGLDYNEKYRNLPYVGILKPEVYAK